MLKVYYIVLVVIKLLFEDKIYGSSTVFRGTQARLCSSSRQVIRVVDTISEKDDRVLKKPRTMFFYPIPPTPPLNITREETNKKKSSKTLRQISKTVCSTNSNYVLQPDLDLPFIPPPPPQMEQKVRKNLSNQFGLLTLSPKTENEKKICFYERDDDVEYIPIEEFKRLYSLYIAIDTEATGLGNGHTLTEIAAVKIRNFQPTGEIFHTHINPNRTVSYEAEKITGYNWNKLRKAPKLRDIISKFSDFIGQHPLVFHNAHFDCKLINEGKKSTKSSSDPPLSSTNTIIDTQVLSNYLFPTKGNGLKSLATKFKIDSLLENQMHGALSDAFQLTGVFRELIKINNGKFYIKPQIKWELLSEVDIYKEFEEARQTDAELLFRRLGVICEIPKSFRFSHNMFDPLSGNNFPAVIFMLTSFKNEVTGYFVRFLELPEATPITHKKLVFGTENNGMISLNEGSLNTVVIGSIPAALHIHTLLKRISETPFKVNELFRVNDQLTVKALSNISHLPTIQFHPSTKKVYILLNTSDAKLTDLEKRVLTVLIEQHLHQKIFPIIQLASQATSLVGYKVKYKQLDWIVDEDTKINNSRILTLKKPFEQKVILEIDVENKTISDSKTLVHLPILISNPTIEFKVIRIGKADFFQDGKSSIENYYSQLSDRIMQQCPLNCQRDIQFIETCEEARKSYASAQIISENSPVKHYFMKRGIISKLPIEFRYLPSVYHPGIEKHFPATLIPLFNEDNIMVGVHRIFCGENGERLGKQNRLPPKLSLGRTAGAAFEIYKKDKEPEVCFISEGFENGIVARDSIKYILSNAEEKSKLFEKFSIKSSFSIKSCVGINGLIDIPFETTVHTIVIIADNDENNPDVKRTLNQTIRSFIKRGLLVYFALPESSLVLKKPDLNDIYFRDNKQNPELVAKVLLSATLIRNANVFTTESISIEEEIRRLSISKLEININVSPSVVMQRTIYKPLQKMALLLRSK